MKNNKTKALILISGGSASGKTDFTQRVRKSLDKDAILYIPMDMYYKSTQDNNSNFDTPKLIDFDLLLKHVEDFFDDKPIDIPVYNFVNHKRMGSDKVDTKIYKFIMIEGIFALSFKKLRDKASFKLFIQAPADTRLARRIKRDSLERGRSIDSIIDRWTNMVQNGYKKHIEPYRIYADLIIPWTFVNERALQIFIHTLHDFGIKKVL